MKRIAVLANIVKPMAADLLRRLDAETGRLGLEWRCDASTGELAGAERVMDARDLFNWADCVLAMGGDGTMLRVVRILDGIDLPVFGLNIGSLGFMTSSPADDLPRALACLQADQYSVSERVLIQCNLYRQGCDPVVYRALNDCVVRAAASRMTSVDLVFNGDYVTSYACDGLIVSTPTGSTGHCLSAGGPIVMPSAAVFVVSVICPHTLSSRPIVFPNSGTLEIRVSGSETSSPSLSVDGQVDCCFKLGDRLTVERSRTCVRFLHMPGHSYFGVMRQKLGWRGSNV